MNDFCRRRLAEEVTVMVHSRSDYEGAVEASQILFGKGTTESLKKMNENTFLSVFEGVPVFDVKMEIIENGVINCRSLCRTFAGICFKGRIKKTCSGWRIEHE